MNEELQQRLRQEELSFFGKMGADVSHDMRNVLSVIGEYAGLLDDLLAMAKGRKSPDPEKLKTLSEKITAQVKKGTQAMERFSRFCHAADEQTTSFDLTALAANTAALAQRRARLVRAKLEATLPAESIPVRGNAFSLQHALVWAIEMILELPQREDSITIALAAQGAAAQISISARAAAVDDLSGRVSKLSAMMAELNGNLEPSCADGAVSLVLTIPTQ